MNQPPETATPRRLLLVFNLCLFLVLFSSISYLNRHLVTFLSPHGMGSFLESRNGMKILDEWFGKSVQGYAMLHTWLDSVFIASYALLAWQLVMALVPSNGSPHQERRDKWLRLLKLLIIIAATLDAIENAAVLTELYTRINIHPLVFWPAKIKSFMLLVIVSGIILSAMRWLSGEIVNLVMGIWMFRLVLISLLMTFFILWQMDQGQDMLLSLNTHWLGPVITLVAIVIFAFCNWFLPKYYQQNNAEKITLKNFFFGEWDYQETADHRTNKYTGRLLGAAGLMIPGVSILHAMQTFHVYYWLEFLDPMIIFIVLIIIYRTILAEQWLCNRRFVVGLAIFTALVIAVSAYLTEDDAKFLGWLATDCLLLSLLFLLYTNVRKGNFKWKWLQKPITPYITFTALAVSLFFLFANINPIMFAFKNQFRLLTLPIVFTAMIFYLFVLSVLFVIGRKKKIQIITFLLIGMLILVNTIPNDFHRVRHAGAKSDTARIAPLQSLDDYANQWLTDRQQEIDSYYVRFNRPYPVFLVNAYGGGIRASAWTGKFIHHLDNMVYNSWKKVRNVPKDSAFKYDFQHYVFSYSGASGGTMGAAVLCAQRYAQLTSDTLLPVTDSLFYSHDFLTPVIIPLLGRDIWLSFVGSSMIPDRARMQEETWEKHARHAFPAFSMQEPMSRYWHSSNREVRSEIPLLFANSYLVDSGLKAVVAPVRIKPVDFPASYLVNNRVGTDPEDPRELRLSTAALLSARFPFISPAGELDDFHHFMDGGLKENSGAETSAEIRIVFERALKRNEWTDEKVSVIMLSVNNALSVVNAVKIAHNVFELGAPLTALMNNWIGNTFKADSVNRIRDSANYDYIFIRPQLGAYKGKLQPVLPLGWQISDASLRFMDYSLGVDTNKNLTSKIVNIIAGSPDKK